MLKINVQKWRIVGLISLILFGILLKLTVNAAPILNQVDGAVQSLVDGWDKFGVTLFYQGINFSSTPAFVTGLMTILSIYIWKHHERVLAFWIDGLVIGGNLLAFTIKTTANAFDLGRDTSGFGFSSSHSFSAMLVVLIMFSIVLPRIKDPEWQIVIGLLTIIWFVLVGISIIYLHAHVISQISATALISIVWWAGMYNVFFAVRSKLAAKIGEKLTN